MAVWTHRQKRSNLIWLPLLITLIFIHTRGIVMTDEGYIVHSAERILRGQLPYRDFHFTYTPASIFLVAGTFILFGKSILAERLLMISFSFISSVILYNLSFLLTKNNLVSLGAVLMFIFFGPAHINFSWPVMMCLSILWLFLFSLVHGLQQEKTHDFFLAGVLVSMMFLFKQNFVFVLCIPLVTLFFLNRQIRKKKYIVAATAGIFVGVLVFLIYLLLTHSFLSFVSDMLVFSIKRIQAGDITTPFLYGGGIKSLVKGLFYLFPLVLGLVSLGIVWREEKRYAFIPLTLMLFYLLEIRPTTDYLHLVPTLATLGLLFALGAMYTRDNRWKILSFLTMIIFILLGIYSSLFKAYYHTEAPLIRQNTFLLNRRVRIYMSKQNAKDISVLQSTVNKLDKRKYLFVNEYEPMIYFLTQKINPSSHDLVTFNPFYRQFSAEVQKTIREKQTTLVITLNKNPHAFLFDYISKNYRLSSQLGPYYLWTKRVQ